MYPSLYERVQISVQTEESWLQQISKKEPSEYFDSSAVAGWGLGAGLQIGKIKQCGGAAGLPLNPGGVNQH